MVIIADRSFRSKNATTLVPFFKTVGTNISTKPLFADFKTLGDDLLAENTILEKHNDAVLARDMRELGSRNTSRKLAIKIAQRICDKVNEISNNDPAVYDEAGLRFVEAANPDRPMGKTKVLSVRFNSKTDRVGIRIRKADKASGYHIDLKTPSGELIKEYAAIFDSKGSFPAPKAFGTYHCRAVPVDSKGNRGEPSDWEEFGVY